MELKGPWKYSSYKLETQWYLLRYSQFLKRFNIFFSFTQIIITLPNILTSFLLVKFFGLILNRLDTIIYLWTMMVYWHQTPQSIL